MKYLGDVGVYEKVDERDAIARNQVTALDTKWTDKKSIRGDRMQIMSRLAARELKSGDWCTGTHPLEAFKAMVSIAAHRRDTFSSATHTCAVHAPARVARVTALGCVSQQSNLCVPHFLSRASAFLVVHIQRYG